MITLGHDAEANPNGRQKNEEGRGKGQDILVFLTVQQANIAKGQQGELYGTA